jgi:hypothetical protein
MNIPTVTRPIEYIAFVDLAIRTGEGVAYVFLAVDAYSDYVFNLGVEPDRSPETILGKVYFLLEHEAFERQLDGEFTLVLGEYEELADRIAAVIRPMNGKVLFNKAYNNYLSNPFLQSFAETLRNKKQ